MGSKIGKEKVEGQTYFKEWVHEPYPRPRLIKKKLEVYIDGVTYYPKVILSFAIYDDRNHVVFRMGKEIFTTLAEVIKITG